MRHHPIRAQARSTTRTRPVQQPRFGPGLDGFVLMGQGLRIRGDHRLFGVNGRRGFRTRHADPTPISSGTAGTDPLFQARHGCGGRSRRVLSKEKHFDKGVISRPCKPRPSAPNTTASSANQTKARITAKSTTLGHLYKAFAHVAERKDKMKSDMALGVGRVLLYASSTSGHHRARHPPPPAVIST